MFTIHPAVEAEFEDIRTFYHTLIDMMENAAYKPGWKKGVYPSDAYLMDALRSGTLYVGRLDGGIAAAMIANHEWNDGYRQVEWGVAADRQDITVIHALGVLPSCAGKGLAKSMMREAIALAEQTGQKAIRLDVLRGNVPAENLYKGIGFQYVGTVPMFYEDTGWTDYLLYEYPL